MGIKIAGYLFEGSYMAPGDLKNKSGLFLVTDLVKGRHQVLDLDHADKVRRAVESHVRRDCWTQKSEKGELRVSVLYTPELTAADRDSLVIELRKQVQPACGNAAAGLYRAEMSVEG